MIDFTVRLIVFLNCVIVLLKCLYHCFSVACIYIYMGCAEKLDHYYNFITPVYNDAERCYTYQNIQFFIQTNILNVTFSGVITLNPSLNVVTVT